PIDVTRQDVGGSVPQAPKPVPGLRPEPVALRAAAWAVAGRRHIDNKLWIRFPQAPSPVPGLRPEPAAPSGAAGWVRRCPTDVPSTTCCGSGSRKRLDRLDSMGCYEFVVIQREYSCVSSVEVDFRCGEPWLKRPVILTWPGGFPGPVADRPGSGRCGPRCGSARWLLGSEPGRRHVRLRPGCPNASCPNGQYQPPKGYFPCPRKGCQGRVVAIRITRGRGRLRMPIMLSYSRKDEAVVKGLARDLEAAKREVWFDHNLIGGDAWWDSILENIRLATVFIF